MATTRNLGQILIDKAQEIDPSFKPDKFNDAGDALDIVLKNVSIPSYYVEIEGANWALNFKGIPYTVIKGKDGFETKLIEAAQTLSKKTFKDAEEAKTWIETNWENFKDYHGLLFAALIGGLKEWFYNATARNNVTTLTTLIAIEELLIGNVLGIGSNDDGATLTTVYNLLTDTETSLRIIWNEDGGTCLKDW